MKRIRIVFNSLARWFKEKFLNKINEKSDLFQAEPTSLLRGSTLKEIEGISENIRRFNELKQKTDERRAKN